MSISGGFSRTMGALVARKQVGLQERQLEMQERQIEQQEQAEFVQGVSKQFQNSMNQIREATRALIEQGKYDEPQSQAFINDMAEGLYQISGAATQDPAMRGVIPSAERIRAELEAMPLMFKQPVDPKQASASRRFTHQEILDDPTLPNSLANDDTIVEADDKGMTRITSVASAAQGGDQRERKIADAITSFGMSREDAVGFVDGWIRIETDPAGGVVRLLDNRNQSVRELGITPSGEQSDGPERDDQAKVDGKSLFELADVATGPAAAVRSAAAFGLGFLPEGMRESGIFPQATLEARQRFQSEAQSLIRSISINPRFPVAEMERIRKEIQVLPKFLDNAPAMRARMTGLDYTLEQRYVDAMRDASDTSLDRNTRNSARTSARGIDNFRRQMGVPQPLSLDTVEDVASANPESLRGFIATASDRDLMALPDDVAEAIQQALGQ